MTKENLFKAIIQKKSYLCVGLDTDMDKIPKHLLQAEDPIFEFNRQIIDATREYCVAYKPNIAFYESLGPKGWESLKKTLEYIPRSCFTIADAKRGDIGNTSRMYAKAFFEQLNFDSITVAPYMGSDSVLPFLEFKEKWVILLALTSNEGGLDFQNLKLEGREGERLFEKVLSTSKEWGNTGNMMYVVGATRTEMLKEIRKIIPDHFLLVPGVGAQGGDLHAVSEFGMNKQCGLLINSSRAIIYASNDESFAENAGKEASNIQKEMSECLKKYL